MIKLISLLIVHVSYLPLQDVSRCHAVVAGFCRSLCTHGFKIETTNPDFCLLWFSYVRRDEYSHASPVDCRAYLHILFDSSQQL
jgi:hypothetical protein